ncbi:MAG: tol-pal system protein YbgF [Proteobacteria bacterium]|jgi:tol-pal system protein YbgF|nr:tol-pal system protein YbgF [Pseudomonadota bacterium]
MKKYFWVGLLFVANSAFAIFEDEEARKKLNSIQDQLDNIQKNIDYKVNQAIKNQNLIKFQNELSAILDQISKLNGEIEVLHFQSKNSEERQKILYQELNDRLRGLELNIDSLSKKDEKKINIETTPESSQAKDAEQSLKITEPLMQEANGVDETLPDLVDKNIELTAFSEAKALLRATKYKESFDAFDRFVTIYPKSELISEAKYYVGYSQYSLKNYSAAIKTYTKILEVYPDGNMLPEAMYGIANCQIQLTEITKAKISLQDLIKKYPNADIIPSAQSRLKALESIKF